MQRRALFSAALVAAVAVAFGTTGCTDEEASGSGHSPTAAIRDLQDAFEAGDAAASCDRMTPEVGQIAHGETTTCERAVQQAFKVMSRGGWDKGKRPSVARVEAKGARATATVEDKEGQRAKVELLRKGGAWKLASLVGMPLGEFDEFEDDLRSFALPTPDSKPLDVVDGSGAPCPDFRNGNYPRVKGGCVLEVSGRNVPVRLLTAFGDFELSKCSVSYRVEVSPSGRTWTSMLSFDNLLRDECSAIEACLTETWAFKPWTGRLERDGHGGYTHRTLMCLRTGVGLLGGEFVTRLVRDGKGWKVEPSNDGDTGFKIDGELAVTGEPFDIRGH